MLLPAGTEVDPSAVIDERAPKRTFVTAPPAGPPVIGPSGTAEVDGAASAPVDTAAVEAEAVVALSGPAGATDGATGIPVTVLAAYRKAEALLAAAKPSCHLPWWLLAGVGRIETGHVYGGRVDEKGNTRGRITGPVLDGSMPGTAVIRDSDGGKWDGDAVWDRAVGPMQFLPGSWVYWGKDGNSDGVSDPHNVFDATVAAGYLLCSAGDLSNPATMGRAVLRYNHSASYVATVLKWAAAYRDNVTPAPDSTGSVPSTPARTTTTAPPAAAPSAPAPTTSTTAPPPATTTAPPKPPTSSTTTAPPSTTTTTTTPPPTSSTTTAPTTTTTTAPPSSSTTTPTATTTGSP